MSEQDFFCAMMAFGWGCAAFAFVFLSEYAAVKGYIRMSTGFSSWAAGCFVVAIIMSFLWVAA